MTIENRDDVVRRVEQHYKNSANKGKPFDGTPREKAEKYAMKRCRISAKRAKSMVGGIAQTVRGKIIAPKCTSKCKKGDSVKEVAKAKNAHNAQAKREWKVIDYAADPDKENKRRRDKYATNEDYADKIKQNVAERRKKRRLANEDSLWQAAKAVRDLGKKVTPDDLLKQVYKARPDTRNAQALLNDRFTIFHITHVAPHELDPAGLLVPFDSHLEDRKKSKKKKTPAELKSMEKVWGTPRSLADALHGFMHLHGGNKVDPNKDLYVYAITESHRQYDTFHQHTIRGKNGNISDAPKYGRHFVWSLENIAVGENVPGVVVLRIPWTNDNNNNNPVPDIAKLKVMYCNAGE
jgi:hypothetical protein